MPKKYIDRELIEKIGLELRRIREEKGLSQYIVDIDMDTNTSRIERGQVNVTISTLSKLCKYYGVTVAELFAAIDARCAD